LSALYTFLRRCWPLVLLITAAFAGVQEAAAQEVTLTARVATVNGGRNARLHQAGEAVFWLVPNEGPAASTSPRVSDPPHPQLIQRNKSFVPHLLVVPVGSVVQFPNRDPFFHNVFSLFEGKRFDLGLYEAGSTRDVRFDKAGISYIFCDIHPEMSAVIIALPTPYYGVSDQRGQVVIPNVPSGRYTLHVWHEAAMPEELNSLTREIAVSENSSTLGVFRLAANRSSSLPHKNKYGQDYDPPTPDNPAYARP
jgi:plastocyanin